MQEKVTLWHYAFSQSQLKISFKTSLIVGTLLNVINQWDAIMGAGNYDVIKIGLTYLVPFCVATYAGAKGSMNCEN